MDSSSTNLLNGGICKIMGVLFERRVPFLSGQEFASDSSDLMALNRLAICRQFNSQVMYVYEYFVDNLGKHCRCSRW